MKVINLLGGPGIGKSTIAADVYSAMKWEHMNVELVTEFAKELAWEERHLTFKDQSYLFAKQNHKLWRLKGKVDYVINDSPLLLVLAYQPKDYYDNFEPFVKSVWNSYDNLNILLNRVEPFHENGRIHSEWESRNFDRQIKHLCKDEKYHVDGNAKAKDTILNIVKQRENVQFAFDFGEIDNDNRNVNTRFSCQV